MPATGLYYGTTVSGGTYDLGTVFSMSLGGTRTTLVSFSGTDGAAKGEAPDCGLILASDGALYGTTSKGGANNCGTIFRLTTGGSFLTLVQFTGDGTGANRGSAPNALLESSSLLGLSITFHGTTQGGGAYEGGTIFNFTVLLQTLSVGGVNTLFDFSGTSVPTSGSQAYVSGSNPVLGANPVGPLVTDGNSFYGVAQNGGTSDFGTVFKTTPPVVLGSYTFSTLTNFKKGGTTTPGAYPAAGPVLIGSTLYGTTEFGGSGPVDGYGTVFKVNTNGTGFQCLYQFDDDHGSQPAGELIVGSDGALYGTTYTGGDFGSGTIFSITTSGAPIMLHSFFEEDGEYPRGGLTKLASGDFIGTASGGAAGEYGTVFTQSNPTFGNTFQVIGMFTNSTGWRPAGTPAFDISGNSIYQPMALGGPSGYGTLLKVDGSSPSVVTSFADALGEEPNGGLRLISGTLFGMAKSGGAPMKGTIFRYQPGTGTSVVATLTETVGRAPEGPMVQGPDGNIYGVAREGGAFGFGAILKINPAGGVTNLLSFTGNFGSAPGMWPHAPLAVGADGNLYGVTEQGGSAESAGTVFKVTLGGSYTLLKAFTQSGPWVPLGGLTPGAAGEFYGSTALGGTANVGTIFKITATGTFTVLGEFGGASGALRGAYPVGELLYAFDGGLYGVAAESGAGGAGTIFRIKSDNTAETLFDFTNVGGAVPGGAPRGGLAFGNDGYLYGATEEGGPRGGGVIYRIKNLGPMTVTDPITYNGLVAMANGRAQTGGDTITVSFEIALLPELLPLSIYVPGQVTMNNNIAQFSMPVPTGLLGQLINVRAVAKDSANNIAKGVIRNTAALLPLQEWKTQYFGNASTPDLDDTDHDGAKNLTEYATVKDPTVPNGPAASAPILKAYGDGTRLALFVTRDPARNDVTIEVQAASSPAGPWTTVASSVNGAPFSGTGYVGGDGNTSGIKTVEIRDVPPANATSRFMRVVASH